MALVSTIEGFDKFGYAVIEGIYSEEEIALILDCIDKADQSGETFRRNKDVFAIRQFLKEVPAAVPVIFNEKLREVINRICSGYFAVKSIYFDKPATSNWFVAWHQDLTISVDKKVSHDGFVNWTVKQNQFAVQPPVNILQDNFTIRLHLDAADAGNGALKVLPGSHGNGITPATDVDRKGSDPVTCSVSAGGVMLMRPLLMHSSDRTTNSRPRTVIHIEFSRSKLPEDLHWSERIEFATVS